MSNLGNAGHFSYFLINLNLIMLSELFIHFFVFIELKLNKCGGWAGRGRGSSVPRRAGEVSDDGRVQAETGSVPQVNC